VSTAGPPATEDDWTPFWDLAKSSGFHGTDAVTNAIGDWRAMPLHAAYDKLEQLHRYAQRPRRTEVLGTATISGNALPTQRYDGLSRGDQAMTYNIVQLVRKPIAHNGLPAAVYMLQVELDQPGPRLPEATAPGWYFEIFYYDGWRSSIYGPFLGVQDADYASTQVVRSEEAERSTP